MRTTDPTVSLPEPPGALARRDPPERWADAASDPEPDDADPDPEPDDDEPDDPEPDDDEPDDDGADDENRGADDPPDDWSLPVL